MHKNILLSLIILASVCFCLYAESENAIGVRFDYSLQQNDVKKTSSETVRAFSDYGVGGGFFYNQTFDNNMVLGADFGINFYSYEKSGFPGTYLTLDFLVKCGYRFSIGNKWSSVVALTAGLDFRKYGQKKGFFTVIGLDALCSYAVSDSIDVGLGSQAQLVFHGIVNDQYGVEKTPVFNFYAALTCKI